MNETEPFQRAYRAALRLLSYRPRSRAEVRDRLLRRFPASVAERVVEKLGEQSLIDDAKFARHWRESRSAVSPRSAWAIERELVAKGIDRTMAAQVVQDLDDEESAYRAGLKPARKLRAADMATFRRRLSGYLQRRGFTDSLSWRTIDRLWEEHGASDRE